MTPQAVPTDNPAGKLFTVLSYAKTVEEKVSTKDGWTRVFRHFNINGSIYSSIDSLKNLLGDLKSIMDNAEDHIKLGITTFENIEYILNFDNFPAPWAHVQQRITPELLAELRCTSGIFKVAAIGIIEPPNEELLSIRSELTETYEKILSSNLDEKLKIVLCEMLDLAIKSIDGLIIRGMKDIERSIELVFAKSILHHQTITDNKSPLIGDFKRVMSRYITVTTAVLNTTGIAALTCEIVKAIAQ